MLHSNAHCMKGTFHRILNKLSCSNKFVKMDMTICLKYGEMDQMGTRMIQFYIGLL